jgi:hypothetical protein
MIHNQSENITTEVVFLIGMLLLINLTGFLFLLFTP